MADVKFSELSELAAADVASDDILAVVDTNASTSKKLTINSLFGEVPVNIASMILPILPVQPLVLSRQMGV